MKKKFLFVLSLFAAALFTVAMAQSPEKAGKCGENRTECCEKAVCDDCACSEECKDAACADCKQACCEKQEACADKPCAEKSEACCAEAAGDENAEAKPCCRNK